MNNIEHDYLKLLHDILHNGIEKDTRNGKTRSVFGRQIRHDMSLGFPLLTTKKMPFRLIATELMWFLRGDTNIKYLVDNGCHVWDGDAYKNYERTVKQSIDKATQDGILKDDDSEGYSYLDKESFIHRIKTDSAFAEKWGSLGKIYGQQWRNWNGNIDQISDLIGLLKESPDSRRMVVNAWAVHDLPNMVLPPCHYGFQVYTRELTFEERWSLYSKKPYDGNLLAISNTLDHLDDKNIPTRAISLMWNQRSVDTFLGLPFNIASYGLLLEIIAKAVGMVPDELIGNLGDVHLYENHLDQAKEQLTREPIPLPTLNINTEWWPTEGGECGEGPLDAQAVFNGFTNDNFCKCLLEEDLQLGNYDPHPTIKAPLSN